jgi:hypothetical protein
LLALSPVRAQDAPVSQNPGQQQEAKPSPAPVAPASLPAPAITGPLQAASPHAIGGDIMPSLVVNGIVSGMGWWQGNPVPGDEPTQAALSNAMLLLQKTAGWWQFYVQAGGYNIPILGTQFLSTEKTISDLFGLAPVAYLKLAPAKNTSILIGSLPTLMGAESTFSFQNMNVNRGLLWNQENDVNRGIQLNQALGRFSVSVSWNDGFYSNRYSWLSGALSYTAGPHTLSFTAMGNLSQTAFRNVATPVQNNSRMYALIYTCSKKSWIVQPYVQLTDVPTNVQAGIPRGASTAGGAVLVDHTFKHGLSLAGRGEYVSSTGTAAERSINLLYGPGSAAWSATLTPTYQAGRFFVRGDLALVRVTDETAGFAFGQAGTQRAQPRATAEFGFLF